MEAISKKVNVEEVTLTLNSRDLHVIGRWQSALASATKENAYGLVKDLAGDLEQLLQFLTGINVDKVVSVEFVEDKIVKDEKVQEEPVRNGKRSSKKTTKRDSYAR